MGKRWNLPHFDNYARWGRQPMIIVDTSKITDSKEIIEHER